MHVQLVGFEERIGQELGMGWAASIWRMYKCARAFTAYNYPIAASRTQQYSSRLCNQTFSYGALKVLLSGGTDNAADVTEMQYRFVATLIRLH